jgi:hypothetical protein
MYHSAAGLPDVSWYKIPRDIPRGWKIYQRTTKLQNAHKIFPLVVKYSKWPKNMAIFFILYTNWDFWYGN